MDTRATEALRTILPIAGWADERVRTLEITGEVDPILPTSFRIAETAAKHGVGRGIPHTSHASVVAG